MWIDLDLVVMYPNVTSFSNRSPVRAPPMPELSLNSANSWQPKHNSAQFKEPASQTCLANTRLASHTKGG